MVGSANFTKKGLEVNHEADVEVISKSMGTAFNKMFEDHWENRSVDKTPNLPDFQQRPPEKPVKEIMGRELYRYFTANFHPSSTRVFAGKRKQMVLDSIQKFDKTEDAAPVPILGAPEGSVPEAKEMETIGGSVLFLWRYE